MSTWNETTEGAALEAAWQQLLYTYNTRLPTHVAALANLANRPITG
jgi:hypothetical protein